MNYQAGYSLLTPQILLEAYGCGLFPMAESAHDPEIFWVNPDTRGIIPLDKFHMSKSLKKVVKRQIYEIRINSDFYTVIKECAAKAPDRTTTWINGVIIDLYQRLHEVGHAHSVEAWIGNKLAGGLYGVSLGSAFFGESMFSRCSNASKVCLVHLVNTLIEKGFTLLDTQFTTEHLKQFGAIDISRDEYNILLSQAMDKLNIPFDN